MYLYLNRYSHIISINEKATYVRRNVNGIIVPCMIHQAFGVIDDTGDNIYYLKGKNIIESYTDIFSVQDVQEIPDGVVPRKYSYIDGKFVKNELYEDTTENLTSQSNVNTSDITNNRAGIEESFESSLVNADDIADVRTALEEVYELIANEEE